VPETGGLKNLNKHTNLDLIRFTPGGISRAELARQVGLSRSAVSVIVDEFLQADIVHVLRNAETSSGRRPILLEINPGHGRVVGVDIGATHLTLILADLAANTLQKLEVAFDVAQGPAICLDHVDGYLRQMLAITGIHLDDILAVGVGVPGPIAGDGRSVVAPPIMPGWDGYPICSVLQKRWNCPVLLNNDAELGALGEWAYGAGRRERNLVYIKVGSGVGAELVLGDHIYHGTTGRAGEIGHITIQEKGPLCTCGNYGCLETLAGGHAIAKRARQAVLAGGTTQLSGIGPVEQITAQNVALAAHRGDLVAQQIVIEAGRYFGIAIAGLINLLNPGIVVIGGGVAQTGDLLLEPIRQTVRERSLKAASQAVRITSAVLGRRSSGIGAVIQAATLVLHHSPDPLKIPGVY
jgi:glucokinase-like ROK family protein